MTTVAYSYIRFSTPEQRQGDSVRRQTEAAAAWCQQHGARLDTSRTFQDLGKSAFLGNHRKNPDRYALAAFLKMVEDGKIIRGSYLVIESLDRLTREHVRPALMLTLGLIEAGIRIVQLSPAELVYDERSDEMGLMMMIMELSRGHRESKRKSDLSGENWRKKKASAQKKVILTRALPSWVRVQGDKLALIPERAAVIKQIFQLAASGYGTPRIVAKLTDEKVPSFGGRPGRKSDEWARSTVSMILRDRRVLGEYQPKRRSPKGRLLDGDPVPGYFPAVVSEEEFAAARAGAAERGKYRGRLGKEHINVFAGLLKNAREGDAYYLTVRSEITAQGRKRYPVLINYNGEQGRSPCWSFPFPVFEAAILEKLRELDPHEILNGDQGPDETLVLSGQLAGVETELASAAAWMESNGFSATIGKRIQSLEENKKDLARRLAEARQRAATPLSESWGAAQSLMSAIDQAPDPEDARLRLRSALRRMVDSIYLLVVPHGRDRICAVQVHFAGGKKRRDYLILHRPPRANGTVRTAGSWEVRSLATVAKPDDLDLRKPDHARRLEKALAGAVLGDEV
jgi:DNA invertase Pin-like site-specific DNA recombinase